MKYDIRDIAEYIIVMIGEFAKKFNLSEHQAYRYLKFHHGISFLQDHYEIIHTLDFKEALESITIYCRNSGGKL